MRVVGVAPAFDAARVVEFAGGCCGVAVVAEVLRQGDEVFDFGAHLFEAEDTGCLGHQAAHDAGARRTANRPLAVGVKKGCSLGAELVEVRGLCKRIAVGSDDRFHVVGGDE